MCLLPKQKSWNSSTRAQVYTLFVPVQHETAKIICIHAISGLLLAPCAPKRKGLEVEDMAI